MVGADDAGAGVRRAARPHRQRGSPAAGRLALPRGRAVLRGDPRQPDGAGEPPPVPLDPRPDQRLLGRGVHRGRVRRARRRARRPVRLHRQPGQQPVGPDARRARHHPGRPGRHHPRRVPRRARRRRRAGHRQDRRRPAPHRLPALLRPAPRPPPRRRAVRRPAPALPGLRRRRPAQPRRGGRADLHPAGPRPRGRRGRGRDRPGGGPAEVVRGHGAGDRAGRPVLRGAAHRGHGRSRPPGPTSGSAPPTGPRRSTRAEPGTPHNEARDQVWEELLTILVDKHDDDEVPTDQLRAVAARRTGSCTPPSTGRGRCSRPTDLVGDLWSVPAYLRMCAPWLEPRRGRDAAARGPAGLDGVRPAAPGRGPAAARRPGGVPAQAPAGGRRRGRARGDGPGRRPPDRDRRLRDAGDVDAARRGPAGRPGRRGRAARAPTRTCSPARSRTSSWTRPRS